jgi:hypothetical protein
MNKTAPPHLSKTALAFRWRYTLMGLIIYKNKLAKKQSALNSM